MVVSIPYGSIKRAASSSCLRETTRVSIPYGSIKRSRKSNILRRYEVSIPYGSIKSTFVSASTGTIHSFQFLMVRLKVIRELPDFVKVKFQFLMVRLKGQCDESVEEALGGFQFLMVRLKENQSADLLPQQHRFNSLWFD